jgi:chromosome partitioning protein
MLRVPTGITHVVLDTPGGMHGFELARVVMFADAIIMPVCNSMFDRESAAQCHADLMALPRVASGRCRLATVGMRIDGRTSAAKTLEDWSEELGMPFLGALRETQLYVRSLERGMTIFDLAGQHRHARPAAVATHPQLAQAHAVPAASGQRRARADAGASGQGPGPGDRTPAFGRRDAGRPGAQPGACVQKAVLVALGSSLPAA